MTNTNKNAVAGSTEKNEQQQTATARKFTIGRLRRNCFKIFGVTTSTFDGATHGQSGEFTVEEMRKRIEAWKNVRALPQKKEDK